MDGGSESLSALLELRGLKMIMIDGKIQGMYYPTMLNSNERLACPLTARHARDGRA